MRGVQRLRRGLRGDDPVVLTIALAQIALDRVQHFAIVVDGQNDRLGHDRRGNPVAAARWGVEAGSVTQNSVPLAARVHVDRAVMALHDAAGDVEAEARALADVLGREKRIEDAVRDVRGNARPVVDDPHDDLALDSGGLDADVSAGRGVDGVVEEVRPHLVELAAVALDCRQMLRDPTSTATDFVFAFDLSTVTVSASPWPMAMGCSVAC